MSLFLFLQMEYSFIALIKIHSKLEDCIPTSFAILSIFYYFDWKTQYFCYFFCFVFFCFIIFIYLLLPLNSFKKSLILIEVFSGLFNLLLISNLQSILSSFNNLIRKLSGLILKFKKKNMKMKNSVFLYFLSKFNNKNLIFFFF